MIGSVYTIGFLAETPPTLDFFHILFAVSRKAGMAVFLRELAALTKIAVKAKNAAVKLRFFRADSLESGRLPT